MESIPNHPTSKGKSDSRSKSQPPSLENKQCNPKAHFFLLPPIKEKNYQEFQKNNPKNSNSSEANSFFCPFLSKKTQGSIDKTSTKLPVIASSYKFFKLHPKITANPVRHIRTKGKSVHWDALKEISEKESQLSKLEERKLENNCNHPKPFDLHLLIKDFFSKSSKSQHRETKPENGIIKEKLGISEEDFNEILAKFHEKKLLKSKELMRYFAERNSQLITGKMGKCLIDLLFSSVENNRTSFELIENIHKAMEISREDFNIFKGLFLMTIRENSHPESEVQKIAQFFEKTRTFIEKVPDFAVICPNKQLSLDDFLTQMNQKLRDNNILDRMFGSLPEEKVVEHQKKVLSMVCNGFRGDRTQKILREAHHGIGVTLRDCFELKKVFMDAFLAGNPMTFSNEFKHFRENLQNIHKFILSEPNMYSPRFETLNYPCFVDFLLNGIQREIRLNRIFQEFSNDRLKSHCRYLIDFVVGTENEKNGYVLSDLIPAHCKIAISSKEFDVFCGVFDKVLVQLKLPGNERTLLRMNLQRCRGFISRSGSLLDLMGGIETIDAFVETLFPHVLVCPESKQFFLNMGLESVKYRLKLFLARLLNDEVDGVDLVDLRIIHEKMGIRQRNFDGFVRCAEKALTTLKIKKGHIDTVLERINVMRDYICNDM